MMSAAACSRGEECLRNRATLQRLKVEVAIVDSDALRCFRWNQEARRRLAGLRDGFHNALPLRFQITNPLPSNASTTGASEVRHIGSNIENVSIARVNGSCLNQRPGSWIDYGDRHCNCLDPAKPDIYRIRDRYLTGQLPPVPRPIRHPSILEEIVVFKPKNARANYLIVRIAAGVGAVAIVGVVDCGEPWCNRPNCLGQENNRIS